MERIGAQAREELAPLWRELTIHERYAKKFKRLMHAPKASSADTANRAPIRDTGGGTKRASRAFGGKVEDEEWPRLLPLVARTGAFTLAEVQQLADQHGIEVTRKRISRKFQALAASGFAERLDRGQYRLTTSGRARYAPSNQKTSDDDMTKPSKPSK